MDKFIQNSCPVKAWQDKSSALELISRRVAGSQPGTDHHGQNEDEHVEQDNCSGHAQFDVRSQVQIPAEPLSDEAQEQTKCDCPPEELPHVLAQVNSRRRRDDEKRIDEQGADKT